MRPSSSPDPCRLAERFGGLTILAIAVCVWCLFSALTPVAASVSLPLLLVTRMLMGMGEGMASPSIHRLLSRWVPYIERSRLVTYMMLNILTRA